MKIDRHAHRLRRFTNSPEALFIEKRALGMPIDHNAFQSKIADTTLELAHRSVGICRRYGAEANKALRMLLDRFVKAVVRIARERDRDFSRKSLSAGLRKGEYLEIDPQLHPYPAADRQRDHPVD